MLGPLRQAAASVCAKLTRSSDFARWRNTSPLEAEWSGRNELIASLIPAGSIVLEFGAGRQILAGLLKDSCTYIASDIVQRTPQTIACDLNAATLPPLPSHSVAVFSGVLEYIHDVGRAIEYAGRDAESIVASYVTTEAVPKRFQRLANGWVNSFSQQEFERLFECRGWYAKERHTWTNQHIWLWSHVDGCG